MLPATSTISEFRMIGSGGENCQCIVKVPGAIAHTPILAMRKSGPHPVEQVLSAPRATAPQPACRLIVTLIVLLAIGGMLYWWLG